VFISQLQAADELRRLSEPEGGWKKFQNEESYNLYPSPDICIIKIIKSKMGGVRRKHGGKKNVCVFCWEIQKKIDQLEDLDLDRDNIKMDHRKIEWGGYGLHSSGSR
jgi:hypothetical protein